MAIPILPSDAAGARSCRRATCAVELDDRDDQRNATLDRRHLPGQYGRTAIVTGANTGIGFATASVLAERGATVVLACRNGEKATDAVARIKTKLPHADVQKLSLDLSSLASVRAAAEEARSRYPRVDLLINNAGVMMPPYSQTADGFELQFGTNHLGHFAFTGLLLDRLLSTADSRIVTVSSGGHRMGRIRFDDLQSQRRYRRLSSYGQSKLANLLFSYQLQRRLTVTGAHTIAVAAHPGGADTELQRSSPRWIRVLAPLFPHQSAEQGALPILRAAVDRAVKGGEYYGPDGRREFTGYPVRVESSDRSHDTETQTHLWSVSEELTGVRYQFAELPAATT